MIPYLKRMSKVDAVAALLCYLIDIAASAAAMSPVIAEGRLRAAGAFQLVAYGAYIAFDLALSYVSAMGIHSKASLSMLHAFLVFQASAGAALAIAGLCGPIALGGRCTSCHATGAGRP